MEEMLFETNVADGSPISSAQFSAEAGCPVTYVHAPEICGGYGELQVVHLRYDDLEADPDRPRTAIDEDKTQALRESIKEYGGVLDPLQVKRMETGKYRIVSGYRRYLAAKDLLDVLPCVVMETEEADMWSVEANLQHEELNPVERALAIKRYKEQSGFVKDCQVAEKLGMNKCLFAMYMAILVLPKAILDAERQKDVLTFTELRKLASAAKKGATENEVTVMYEKICAQKAVTSDSKKAKMISTKNFPLLGLDTKIGGIEKWLTKNISGSHLSEEERTGVITKLNAFVDMIQSHIKGLEIAISA